jgi:hypothetical protein
LLLAALLGLGEGHQDAPIRLGARGLVGGRAAGAVGFPAA